MKEYAQMFKRAFDFKGRSTVREFWLAQIFNTLFIFVLCLLALPYIKDYVMFYKAVMALDGLYNVIVFIPSISLLCRRFRDAGFSSLIALVALVPVIGIIILFCVLCMPSKQTIKPVYDNIKADNIQSTNDICDANNFGLNVENNDKNKQNLIQNNEILQKSEQNQERINDVQRQGDDRKVEKITENKLNDVQSKEQKKTQPKKVSKAQQISRSQKIKKLQEKRDSGEISIQEYQQEIIKILSK